MKSSSLLVLHLLLFSTQRLPAQVKETERASATHLPKQVLKLGPLHLMNFYPTLQIAFEQRMSNNFTVQADVGYVLTFMHSYDTEFQNKRGFKFRLEPRYYIPALIRPRSAFYFSLQPYLVHIDFDRETSQVECYDLNCTIQYLRWYNLEVRYREQGVAFQYGIHLYNRRITLDVSLGTVLRNIEYKYPPIITGLQPDFQPWLRIPNEDTRTAVGLAGAFWLGYKLHHTRK